MTRPPAGYTTCTHCGTIIPFPPKELLPPGMETALLKVTCPVCNKVSKDYLHDGKKVLE